MFLFYTFTPKASMVSSFFSFTKAPLATAEQAQGAGAPCQKEIDDEFVVVEMEDDEEIVDGYVQVAEKVDTQKTALAAAASDETKKSGSKKSEDTATDATFLKKMTFVSLGAQAKEEGKREQTTACNQARHARLLLDLPARSDDDSIQDDEMAKLFLEQTNFLKTEHGGFRKVKMKQLFEKQSTSKGKLTASDVQFLKKRENKPPSAPHTGQGKKAAKR